MQKILIKTDNSSIRINLFMRRNFPNLNTNTLYKAFRKKDIKVNKKSVKENYILEKNDVVEVYIIDSLLTPKIKDDIHLNIVYEDENVLILNKPQGIEVMSANNQKESTLIELVNKYLSSNNLMPAYLCHRLDRNTSGIILLAKNKESLDFLTSKMNSDEIKKSYACVVCGKVSKQSITKTAYLFKNEKESRVFITDASKRGSLTIKTKFKSTQIIDGLNIKYTTNKKEVTLSTMSILDVELLTGRTHQIRAHLSHLGHPIIGDGKYGINSLNRILGINRQALCSYKLTFNFSTLTHLSYLNNKIFEITPTFKNSKNEDLIEKIKKTS